MNDDLTKRCPKCNAPVPAEAPQGLCPKCLLLAASTATENGQPGETRPSPSLESVAAAFPQLEILEYIGHGGMGYVYKARQPRLDRVVALKLLPLRANAQPSFSERFDREAKFLAKLSHPNIVAVHDFGQTQDFCYLVMEFVDGVNLRQLLRGGRLTAAQAMALVPKICDALQYAHEEGVLHRDIKPENLLLDARGRIKIADFGIAKLLGEPNGITLTASGAAVGTPHYMAPEQLERPQDVDQRADIYSLGVVFYEMLTGELPLGRFAPPSQKSTVDTRVDDVVLRTLEKERELRYQTAGDVKTQVENITSNPLPASPRPAAPVPVSAPRDQASAKTPSNVKAPWYQNALTGAALVGMSFAAFLLWTAVVSWHDVQSGPTVILGLFIVVLACVGNWIARGVLCEFYASGISNRGTTLAAYTVIAWPILFVDLLLLGVAVPVIRGLAQGPLSHSGAVVVLVLALLLGVLALTGKLGKRWHQHWRTWPGEKLLSAPTRSLRLLGFIIWTSGGLPICLLVVLLGSLIFQRRPDVAPSGPALVLPNAPAGYAIPPALFPESEVRTYRSSLLIPAGYVCTVTATVFSNQVAVGENEAKCSAFLVAPKGDDTEATLSWRLLGATRLADGAPLEFSLAIGDNTNLLEQPFLVTPPESVNVDWAGEPTRIWPPQDGYAKFLLVKGNSEPLPQEARPRAEWAVGVQTRIDPVPAKYLTYLHGPVAGVGASWMTVLENLPSNSEAAPPAPESPVISETNEP
jgi:tRNA A-37 threonylcarbamoyl transferase component Bud32